MTRIARVFGAVALELASSSMLVVAVVSLHAALALDPHLKPGARRGLRYGRRDVVH